MAPPADIHSDDYYRVLGIDRAATDADIAKAYKKLALKHHPDKNPKRKEKAEEDFKRICEAYDVLRNAEKRKTYDQFGKEGSGGAAASPGGHAGPSGFAGGMYGPQGGMTREQADNIFSMFFGGGDPFAAFAGGKGTGKMPGMQSFSFVGRPGGCQQQFQSGHGFGDDDEEDYDGVGNPMSSMMGGMNQGMMGMGPGGFFMNSSRGRSHRPRSSGLPGAKRSRASSSGASRWHECNHGSNKLPFYAMPLETAVTVEGLTQAQEHNSRIGRIADFDPATGRYTVEFDSPAGKISVRPKNLTQLCMIQITGLESKPELNGRSGQIIQHDPVRNRYMVLLQSSTTISLQAGHCVLPPETRVVIHGLGHAEYNGQMAQILSVDKAAKRYDVQCQSNKRIKVKFDNVRC